ncbi:hypothetical protein GCM10020000_46550 [Streptomyces olivoverticillatus]
MSDDKKLTPKVATPQDDHATGSPAVLQDDHATGQPSRPSGRPRDRRSADRSQGRPRDDREAVLTVRCHLHEKKHQDRVFGSFRLTSAGSSRTRTVLTGGTGGNGGIGGSGESGGTVQRGDIGGISGGLATGEHTGTGVDGAEGEPSAPVPALAGGDKGQQGATKESPDSRPFPMGNGDRPGTFPPMHRLPRPHSIANCRS